MCGTHRNVGLINGLRMYMNVHTDASFNRSGSSYVAAICLSSCIFRRAKVVKKTFIKVVTQMYNERGKVTH